MRKRFAIYVDPTDRTPRFATLYFYQDRRGNVLVPPAAMDALMSLIGRERL